MKLNWSRIVSNILNAPIGLGMLAMAFTHATDSPPPEEAPQSMEEITRDYANPEAARAFLQFGKASDPLNGHMAYCARLPEKCAREFESGEIFNASEEAMMDLFDTNR